ncbi:MAG: DMT family transporter [Tropicimonas sp.]|uniref:DMT family transporter n=1 Tax=Tropicimonas sp. TaxID=2067044 RepID=UPI003A835348
MTAAMAGFALEDMFVKTAAGHMPVGQVLVLFGLLGTGVFSVLAWRRGEALFHPAMLSRAMLLRAGFESGGRLFYTLAIALTPLSNASAIMQATPLVVVAGAALFLGERVGWRRWLAIWVGFAGVLMILRPGMAGFDAASGLAVLGTLGFAGRDLATRVAPRVLSNAQLGICGFSVLVPVGLILLAGSGGATLPPPEGGAALVLGAAFGLAAYAALTQAMRLGEVSVVTPFRYTRLLFGVGLGMIVLGERPDAMTWAGAAVILLSGLYIMARQRRRISEA